MPDKITLKIIEGNLIGQEFTFEERTTCIIGRAQDCHPQLPEDEAHRIISRYHCLLDINPPDIRVRDFGSRNGTYINNKKIGQRQPHQTPEEAAKLKFPEHDLQTGDRIKLGKTVFQVTIEVEPKTSKTLDVAKAKIIRSPVPPKQFNLFEIIKNLLQRANGGEQNLIAIRGYTILKPLGKGGFGEVYLARHQPTNEEVALKVMLPQVAAYQGAIDKFLREMQNTKALQHYNVVRFKDCGFSDNTFFFTMEYCNGGTVLDLMQKQGGKLSIDEAALIILQVLDGLEYAHNAEIPYIKQAGGSFTKGRGLVHRDIKPGNLFLVNVGGTRLVKIGDYGLAKAFDLAGLSGQTMSGSKAGTPVFMPRQQVINFKYAKPEVDVWAAAASFYNMLTGTYPRNFVGADPLVAVLQTSAIPIRQREASIPQRLAEVIDLALVDNPEIPFKTAAEFKQRLLSVL